MSNVEVEAEIVAEEDVDEVRNLPAVRAAEAMVVRGEVSPEEVAGQREKIKQVMDAVMVKEVHYGVIPGVNKPTLLKPGAEVLAVTFRLAPHYDSQRIFHDDGHLTVVSKVTLTHIPTGLTIAEGEGLCTSREKKYAYRGSGRVCPSCGEAGTIKKSKYAPREGDYEGASSSDAPGWYCFAKVGGCGANFAASDPAITGQEEKPVPNPDLPDTFNTVLKMSNKRALIAAILNGTAASDIFTQDVEDSDDRQARRSVEQEQQPTRRDPEVKVPRSWEDIIGRMQAQLGEDEAMEWLQQAKELKEMGAITAQPTLAQRLSGVVVDLEADDRDFAFTPGVRGIVADIFAKRLDGNVLDGPEWCLDGADAAESARPTKEEAKASRG